jgi:ketosteroid isomerase-like protein
MRERIRLICSLALSGLAAAACSPPPPGDAGPQRTAESVVTDLLAADRAFARASAQSDVVSGLSAMFADDVTIPFPERGFVHGRDAAVEALRSNPDNANSTFDWSPIRGGVSADGQHGFTFGCMTMRGPGAATQPHKYLAYWIKGAAGWRVAVARWRPSAEGNCTPASMPPALPARMVPVNPDAAEVAAFARSLADAERAFSDEAQRIGLSAAFARHGSPDAVNMGPATDPGFVVGADAIGRAVGGSGPTDSSPVEWSADRVLVASSGDLGVTIGMIRIHAPTGEAAPPPIPFFTIWRRSSTTEPWRYVAE